MITTKATPDNESMEDETVDGPKQPDKTSDPGRPKPYKRPALTTYGDIREITRAVGMKGMMDGGKGMMMNMVKT